VTCGTSGPRVQGLVSRRFNDEFVRVVQHLVYVFHELGSGGAHEYLARIDAIAAENHEL